MRAVSLGLFVLKLMAIEEPARADGQGACLGCGFQPVDIRRVKAQLAAIEVGRVQPGAGGVEMFHECLQLGMLAPDEGGAVAFLSGLGRFAIGILVEAHGLAPFLRGERGMGFFVSGPFAALGGGHRCL